MNIYVSTSCLNDFRDVNKVLNVYQIAGLKKIELGSGHKYCHRKLSNSVLENKNTYLVHNYFPPQKCSLILNIASGNKKLRVKSIGFIKRAIAFCAQFGIKLYSFHAGLLSDPVATDCRGFVFGSGNPLSPEKAFSLTVDSLREICDYADKKNVKIAIENNPCDRIKMGFLQFCQAEDVKALFRKVESKNLGLLLDLGHLNISANTMKFDKLEFVEQLKSKIFGIHIHENNGIEDEHKFPDESSWAFSFLKKKFSDSRIPMVLESTNLNIGQIVDAVHIFERI